MTRHAARIARPQTPAPPAPDAAAPQAAAPQHGVRAGKAAPHAHPGRPVYLHPPHGRAAHTPGPAGAHHPATPHAHPHAHATGPPVALRGGAARAAADPPASALPILPMPRLTPILAPAVPAPPRDALRRGGEIMARTGSLPETHHALVAQAVQGIAEAARHAQRDIVLQVGLLGRDRRHSIEGLAREVPRLVGGAIATVRAAVAQTRTAVTRAAHAQIAAIRGHREQIGTDFAAVRATVMTEMHQNLLAGSVGLQQANLALQAAYSGHLAEARAAIAAIPEAGVMRTILTRDQIGGAPPAAARPANLEQAGEDIHRALGSAGGKGALRVWQDVNCANALPSLLAQQKHALLTAAAARGAELDSPASRAEFARISLGLIAPTAAAMSTDAEGDRPRVAAAAHQQHQAVQTVAQQAEATITEKLHGVMQALEWTRPKTLPQQVEDGLHKAGQHISKGLRDQARSTEHALRGTAAGLAEAYPEVVARLIPLLPPGVLLDSRVRLPRLAQARASLDRLHEAQAAVARARGDAAFQQARDSLRAQGRSLAETASGGARSVRDMAIPASFDFELVAALYTNPLHAGARLVTDRLRHYAEQQAQALLRPLTAADHGVAAVERSAVGYLNGNIRGEHEGFLRSVRALAEDLEKEGGPLAGIRNGVEADLSARTDKLDGALKAARSGTGILMGGAVYLYTSHSDMSDATRAIGELPWPGAPALEEEFQAKTGGALRDRIAGSSLSDSDILRLQNLMSGDAATRASERRSIAEDSTGWLTGPSRETREIVLRGMGAEERASLPADQLAAWQANLRASLHGTELEIAIGYTAGDPAHVLAARLQERFDKAHGKDDDDIVQATDDIDRLARQELGAGTGAFMPPGAVEDLTNRMFPEFERMTAEPGTPGAAPRDPAHPPTPAEMARAREHFVQYATRPRSHVESDDPDGMESHVVVVPVDARVQHLVRTVVEHGGQSDEAWAERAGYEITRADAESRDAWFGKLSESSQVRLTQHTEDPALAHAIRDQNRLEEEVRTASPERQRVLAPRLFAARQAREEAQTAHRARMQRLAPMLDPTAAGVTPLRAEQIVAHRMGTIFARGNEEDRDYGEEIARLGRASLTAGVRLSVRGLGTNEELLTHVTADRSHLEIARSNAEYTDLYGETMQEAVASDVSGDLAMDMDIALRGEPENDRDRAEIANLRHDQQRVQGTGFISSRTMQGTWQQHELDQRRDELGGAVLDAALQHARETHDTAAIARLSAIPRGAVFGPDGRMLPVVAEHAFDDDGNLCRNRVSFQAASARVGLAATSYKAEIDRQEATLTSLITAAAIAVSVLLLVIPGVNLVAAGVLTALIAGGATIAVKAGMRGGRYGWEEAATDVAMTAIEAVTAGAGGAMGGGLGTVGMAGRLFAVGARLEATLGKFGGMLAREAIVAAVHGAASVALQDETWHDGLGKGFSRVAGGGVRGAATAAVTAGVSAGVTGRLNSALTQAEERAAGRIGRALGGTGRAIVTEAVSSSVAAMAGEATGILSDMAMGHHEGSLRDAFVHIGEAGLRDLLSGAGRAGAHAYNTARYQTLMSRARAGGELSAQDVRLLRLAAISAGVHVGGHPASYDLDPASVQREVLAGRVALAGLPPALRAHLAGADEATLVRANRMLASGEAASPQARAAFLAELHHDMPTLDEAAFARDFEQAQHAVHAAAGEPAALGSADHARQRAARGVLVAELEPVLRGALRGLPMDALSLLPDADLRLVAGMVGRGRIDPAVVETLLHAARAANPAVDEPGSLRALVAAVETGRAAMEIRRTDLARRRPAVLDTEPDAARAGRRAERLARLGDLPEEVRGPLSALPDHALLALQALHAQGEALTPARRARLLDDAARETPGTDLHALASALDAAMAQPRGDAAEAGRLREQLLAAIPAHRRGLVGDAAVLVMEDAAFARFARSRSGDAVTLIVDGRPVVVMRRGADARVLQEEGLHVLQAREPATARQAAQFDERTLAEWDQLPIERQMALYRAKVGLEIDAQVRLIGSLDERSRGAAPEQMAALGGQRRMAEESLANLRRREVEVGAVSALREAEIGAGLADRPDWLDQPARLFSKRARPGMDELVAAIGDGPLARRALATLRDVDAAELPGAVATLRTLADLPGGIGRAALDFALAPRGRSQARREIAARLLATLDVAALPAGESQQAALRLISGTRRDQGSGVPLETALARVRTALSPDGRPIADPIMARVALDALQLTGPEALATHLDGAQRLIALSNTPLLGEAVVRHLLASSSGMDVPGQFLAKVAALGERVAGAADPKLAHQFAVYADLAASGLDRVTVPGTTRLVAPEDLRLALQTMGNADTLTDATRAAIMAIQPIGPRAIDQRLDTARAAFQAQARDPSSAGESYRLAAEIVARHPGGEGEAMLLAQTYGPAIDHLAGRMATDPHYGVHGRAELIELLLTRTEGLAGEALVDGVRRALRQKQMDFVLDRDTLPDQMRALHGMEGAETGVLASDRWGKGKLLELYNHMRAGGDFVGVQGEPGVFVRQRQQSDQNSLAGFGPVPDATVHLQGEPSRSGDGVLEYVGDPAAPTTLVPQQTYLVDTKAGRGAFKEDQFLRYVTEQLRGSPLAPASMTPDGHAGLIYIADTEANAADAALRGLVQLRLALSAAPSSTPPMQVGAPPRPLSAADLSRLRIYFATYDGNGGLRFVQLDWRDAALP